MRARVCHSACLCQCWGAVAVPNTPSGASASLCTPCTVVVDIAGTRWRRGRGKGQVGVCTHKQARNNMDGDHILTTCATSVHERDKHALDVRRPRVTRDVDRRECRGLSAPSAYVLRALGHRLVRSCVACVAHTAPPIPSALTQPTVSNALLFPLFAHPAWVQSHNHRIPWQDQEPMVTLGVGATAQKASPAPLTKATH